MDPRDAADKARRFQFSLRTLFFIITAIAVSVFILANLLRTKGPIDETHVLEKLERLGAGHDYDDDGNLVGVDFSFGAVATDADLAILKGLTHLEELDISGMKLSNVGLAPLEGLVTLKHLDVSSTKSTDADLQVLTRLTALESLDLTGTAVTDASILVLKRLPKLRSVDLSDTRITPTGVRTLKERLPSLQVTLVWQIMLHGLNGDAVIDTDGVTLVFEDIPVFAGGAGGGSVQVAGPESDISQGIGGAVLGASFSAAYKDGVATINIRDHVIEIRNAGTQLVVHDRQFDLTDKKTVLVVDSAGKARRRR